MIKGLHHITALASDPQKNLDFYTGILGLRLVKKTVNFDAPDVYHLYYGDKTGSPGTILTFFPFPDITKGRRGKGQLTVTSFSIPEKAVEYWLKRFKQFNVAHQTPIQRFDELVISFEDHDGLSLELVTDKKDSRPGFTYGNVPLEHAIRGFYGITLSEECVEKTADLLTGALDHTLVAEEGNRYRYSVSKGNYVDLICTPDALRGLGGYGTVHHVAFATDSEATQLQARQKLLDRGLNVTPVLDRQYFHSIYFREPGGVLFEIATLPPGFTVDESLEHLGESLKLPPWEESNRALIEKSLLPIHLDLKRYRH